MKDGWERSLRNKGRRNAYGVRLYIIAMNVHVYEDETHNADKYGARA